MSWKQRKAGYKKSNPVQICTGFDLLPMESHGAGDLAGAEAAGAHIDVLGGAVHHSLDALDVGLPGAVGSAMGVGDLDTKAHALAAELAFGHID